MGYALYSPPKKGRGQRCHQVNRTGPFPVGSPGVAESGLKVSGRGGLSEGTTRTNFWNIKEGRSFRLVPERIDYSQMILDKLISSEKVSELIVSFKKTLANHKWAHEFWEISVSVETRLLYSLSVNQLNLLAQNKGYNQKERELCTIEIGRK